MHYLSFPNRLLGPAVGRPPIGASARDVVAACRLTKAEKALVSARYGSPAAFFRLMIEREMAQGVEDPKEGQE